jgi:hypothetical protein
LLKPYRREGDGDAPGLAELRRFRREDNLSCLVHVFNKSIKGEAHGVRDGPDVMTLAAEVMANDDRANTARSQIPLASLAPGYYALRIVSSEGARWNATSSEWTDFELVP